MLSKVCLWIRRYLRHIILAISIGVFIGILGLILPEFGVNIRIPILRNVFLAVILLSFVSAIVSGIWYNIPHKRIQQSKNPDKWVSAEIKDINDSQYLMYHETLQIDYVDMAIELESDLPFDIKFNSFRGKAIINRKETHSILECLDNIQLPKYSSRIIDRWRLHNWADCIKDFSGNLEGGYIVIQIKFQGEDNKHRKYELTTKGFNYKV